MSQTNEIEKKLKEDFKVFLFVIWKELNLPNPTRVQNDISEFLQEGPKRSIVSAFRGVGKSFITAAFVLWILFREPQMKIMVVSASKERADSFSTFVKRLIDQVEWLQHLRARSDQRDSKVAFDVGPATPDQSPSVKSVGITGQLTGSRADIIIADDIEVVNNSSTQTARDKLSELVKEFDAILKPLPTSRIIYLGTPQCEMSLYNQLPERGYTMRIWPAEYLKEEEVERYKGRLAPIIYEDILGGALPETSTDPQRFSEEDLLERKVSYGKVGYALQFMLDTSLSDADKYPLKVQDLIVMGLDGKRAPSDLTWGSGGDLILGDLPNLALTGDRFHKPIWVSKEFQEYTGRMMFIDPSGRGKDEAGYAVTYFLNGVIYLAEVGGFKDGYSPETLKSFAQIAKKHQVNLVRAESNFGDGMFEELLRPVLNSVYPCMVEGVRHTGQKELRIIDTMEPVLMQHRLVVSEDVIRKDCETTEANPKYSFIYQMTRLTRERGALAHDDRIEAVYGAVHYWTEQMSLDSEEELKSHKDALWSLEMDKFMKGVSSSALKGVGASTGDSGSRGWV